VKAVRVVCYAINGRGLGHLTRQLAIARWMRRLAAVAGVNLELWVLTSSEADTLARREGFLSLKIPSKAMMRDAGVDPARYLAIARGWVVQTLAALQPDLLVVDTFPGGSFGELIAGLELAPQRALVARPVRGDVAKEAAYTSLLPLYGKVIVPDDGGVGPILLREREELPSRAEARRALGIPDGQRAVWLSLGGGGDPAAAGLLPRLVAQLTARGWHAVVAAGPLYVGPEVRGARITWLDRYAGMELLPGVDAAVSAGGYNALHELMYVGVPTVFLPQPRIADDQEGRVDKAVAAGAARLARTADEVAALLESPGSPDAARALVPHNGAQRAAAQLLSMVVPEADVAAAVASFPAALLGHPGARALAPARLVALVRDLGGEAPSRWARLRADVLEQVDAGRLAEPLPARPPRSGALGPVLDAAAAAGAPPEIVAQLVHGLARRWPASAGQERAEAAIRLIEALRPFDDWPGALALMRAMPQQRTWSLTAFADEAAQWLATETDLFDAQRSLVRMEAAGQRGLAETLRLLRQGAEDER
jgi:UDP-N-acetylglucosamine--N-acetylmuramyl-(pentapeptide) pyrophosphoryl-undecaprenol N-acetylglucosamine transferase